MFVTFLDFLQNPMGLRCGKGVNLQEEFINWVAPDGIETKELRPRSQSRSVSPGAPENEGGKLT